jgi:uncharacterized protein
MDTGELRERFGKALAEGEKEQAALRVLRETPWGVLSMDGQGWPYGVPINFACEGTTVYFHGGNFFNKGAAKLKEGFLAANPAVCFGAVLNPTLLDSFAGQENSACHCTFRYESVLVFGRVRLIDDVAERERALRLIVGKYSPAKIDATFIPEILAETKVYVLEAEAVTYKANFIDS